jgi:hypothetical protein
MKFNYRCQLTMFESPYGKKFCVNGDKLSSKIS